MISLCGRIHTIFSRPHIISTNKSESFLHPLLARVNKFFSPSPSPPSSSPSSPSLLPTSHSQTCTSQTFTNNKLYSNCLDLPYLSSYLHYTYTPSTSSLSIAFRAPPATSSGWISWANNPTSTGMSGSQALLALIAHGFLTVQTYNISSYSSVVEGNLSFEVGEIVREMTIFATMSLPVELGNRVNQVWQVGPSVTDGFPDKHAFQAANLNSKGTLDLLTGETTSGGSRTRRENARFFNF